MSLLCALALAAPAPPAAPAAAEAPVLYATAYNVADLAAGGEIGALGARLAEATGRGNWATFGGPGTMRPSDRTASLVVRQTAANHARIVAVLTAWRRRAGGDAP